MSLTLRSDYDVVIVGAGPAGSSAAIRLAENGLRVLLVEKKKFPREKLCGEFISPECLTHFKELGVFDRISSGGVKIDRTVFYARNARSVTVPSKWFASGSYALGLSRAEMDNVLFERARAAGADVLEETQATGVLTDAGKITGVQLKDKHRATLDIHSRLTLDATGRAAVLSKQINKVVKQQRTGFVAFKTHLRDVSIPAGVCEIYAYRGGYGGLSRVENGQYNLCFIAAADIVKQYRGDAAEVMKKVLFTNKRAAASLENAKIVEDWLAVPITGYGRSSLAPAEGLLTIGDAAAFIDPFTGSGILLALESAKIAAGVIAGELSKSRARSFEHLAREYNRRYAAAFDRRLRVSSLLRRAAFVPFLAETVIKTLALSSGLTRLIARATRPVN